MSATGGGVAKSVWRRVTTADRATKARWAAHAALAMLAVLAARAVGHFALEDVPHVMDEIAYAFQARVLAGGELSVPPRLPRGAFAMWFIEDRERMYGIFPPGFPAVLALGTLVGAASWVNPILHGATSLVVARAAGRLGPRGAGDRRIPLVAQALYATSPQAILLGAGFMSHALVALAAAVVLASGLAWIEAAEVPAGETPRAPSSWSFAAAGVALGAAATTRPLCAIVLACVVAIFFVVARRRGAVVLGVKQLAAFGAPVAALAGLLLLYNAALTGAPLRFPQTTFFDSHLPPVDLPLFRYRPGCNALGFGPGHGCEALPGDAHTIAGSIDDAGRNLTAWLWLAGGGPLAFVLAAFAIANAPDRLRALAILAAVPAAIGLYALYWYAGTCYGARFYHAALPGLLAASALGLGALAVRRRRVAGAVFAVVLAYNATLTVLAAREVSHGYWGTDARFAALVDTWREPPALVMVAFAENESWGHHTLTTFMRDVPWMNNIRALGALAQNRPHLDGPVVFARYHPGLGAELRAQHREREAWIYLVQASGDRLVRFAETDLARVEADAAPPAPNFDGYVMEPSLLTSADNEAPTRE